MMALHGIPLVPGSACGRVARIGRNAPAAVRRTAVTTAREDLARARTDAEAELRHRVNALPDGPGRQILRAHLSLLGDPMLTGAIAHHLESGLGAEEALARAASELSARLEALDDPVLRARARDLRDVFGCIARHLTGETLPSLPDGCIVCAAELSPAEVIQLAAGRPLAFVLEGGADSSHTAILMRALGAPAVIGVAHAAALLRDGDVVLVDGDRGQVIVDPDSAAAAACRDALRMTSLESDPQVASTRDGAVVAVTATIAGCADARRALSAGADGIGLFRTEWLFLCGDRLPSEDEQFAAYREVAALVGPAPVTVRVADLGGDKKPPALRLPPEPNPALGLRGVRLLFAHPELLQAQARALASAFAGRRIRLLLPMVNDPGDVAHARELLDERRSDFRGRFEIGAMVETPAAALMADQLATHVDFLSLGTNDLTQYVLAADRESSDPAAPYQPLHPAVLRLIRRTIAAAVRAGKPVSACGVIAGDPRIAALLVGMGVTELSVAPDAITRTKRLIRRISKGAARALADELTALPTAAAVVSRLAEARQPESGADVRTSREAG